MGAKLTKNKSLSISGKTNKQSKELDTTLETTNDDNKQVETNKNKKKQERKLNKKSSKTKVDKSTNTENCVLPLSSFTEQLVGGQLPTLDNNTAQVNAGYQSELANKYVQELRTACLENNITSTEIHDDNQQTSHEYKYQVNIAEDDTNNASVTAVANTEQVHIQEKQQQSIES